MGKTKFSLLPCFVTALLVSCSPASSGEYAEAGFVKKDADQHGFTPRVATAVRALRNQKLSDVSFDVYPGTVKGFAGEWEDSPYNPHEGGFYLKLRIFEPGEAAEEAFYKLADFPNEEKYLITYTEIGGTADAWETSFKEHLTYTFNFLKYASKGKLRLGWMVTYCDASEKETYLEVFNGLGGSEESYLYLKTDGEKAVLSENEKGGSDSV